MVKKSFPFAIAGLVFVVAGCAQLSQILGGQSSTTSKPSAPTSVTATPLTTGDGQLSVSWGAVNGATSYNLYWAAGSNVTTSTGTKIAGATSPEVLNNIPQGAPYSFIVTAVNANGEGAASSPVTQSLTATTNHVYVAGQLNQYPAYWKDGVLHQIGTSPGYTARMIVVTSTNVYVAGNQWSVTPNAPVYWNNDVLTTLAVPTGTTFWFFGGMAYTGTDLIISGTVKDASGNQLPVSWDNGVLTSLSIGTDTTGYTGSVLFTGGHLLIAGSTSTPNTDGNIVAWLDGALQVLSPGSGYGGGWINTLPSLPNLVTSGGDTYLFGTTYGPPAPGGAKPVYWMSNTTSSTVTVVSMPGGTDYVVSGMAVSGSNIYLSGSADQQPNDTTGVPEYWLNGTATALPLPSGASNGSGDYVVATGSDFYIAGDEVDTDKLFSSLDPLIPLYWKDGALVQLALPTGDPNARITGLDVSGSDVYAIATSGTSAGTGDFDYNLLTHGAYWKNGTLNVLPAGAAGSVSQAWWLTVAQY